MSSDFCEILIPPNAVNCGLFDSRKKLNTDRPPSTWALVPVQISNNNMILYCFTYNENKSYKKKSPPGTEGISHFRVAELTLNNQHARNSNSEGQGWLTVL